MLLNIGDWAFYSCSSLNNVYYSGSSSDWEKIKISSDENTYPTKATIHYNYKVLSIPTVKATAGNGKVTITWDSVKGSKKYNIYSCAGGNFFYQGTTKIPLILITV